MVIPQRRFGRTGLQVPAITFGGGWVGGVLIHRDRDEAFAALDLGVTAGIDWIDTAASYGDGVSETVIGEWLRARGGQRRPRISTKFRLDPGAGDLRGQMLRSVEASLGRLGLDSVEVVILHNPVGASGGALDEETALDVAEMMEALRDQGLCRYLGTTALGEPAMLHRVVGAGRFDVAQVYLNMLNPTAWKRQARWNSTDFGGLLDSCAAQDMGVMGIRIFAAGHLASRDRHGREVPITANAADAAEEARAAAVLPVLDEGHGTPAQAALRFGLTCPALSTIVVGLGEIAHLREAITGVGMGPLPQDTIRALEDAWRGPAFTG